MNVSPCTVCLPGSASPTAAAWAVSAPVGRVAVLPLRFGAWVGKRLLWPLSEGTPTVGGTSAGLTSLLCTVPGRGEGRGVQVAPRQAQTPLIMHQAAREGSCL